MSTIEEETSPLLKGKNRTRNVIEDTSHKSSDGCEAQRDNENQQRQDIQAVKKRMAYVFPAFAVGLFLAAADQTIVASTYGVIGSEFNALNKTSWIATGYYLTLTTFQPLYGKLCDIFSPKSCLLTAYTFFGLGCLFSGLAPNIISLTIARAIMGIGGGGMTVIVSIILSETIPLRKRGLWQSYVNIVFATGAGSGAPLGGLLADSVGWRWMFLGQVPMCIVAFVAVSFAYILPSKSDGDWKGKFRRIDFLGVSILAGAIFCLLYGMDHGSNATWADKQAFIPLCISLSLFGLFILVETKVVAEPFAPGRILFQRSLSAAYFGHFCLFATWTAALFYLPLYFQAVRGLSASQAGLLVLPCVITAVIGSLVGGFLIRKTGKYLWQFAIAYIIPVMLLGTIISGFGNGLAVITTLIALLSNSDRVDQAVVTACMYLACSLGSTTGVSLSSTAANQTLRAQLAARLGSGAEAEQVLMQVRRNLGIIRHLDPATREIVKYCYSLCARSAFVVNTLTACGAVLAVWWIKEKPLNKK